MTRKTYGIYGMAEYSALVSSGTKVLRIHFDHGCKTTRGIDPATYTTDNAEEMQVIESSDKYKQGIIKLVSVHAESAPAEAVASRLEGQVYPDVRNSQQAKSVLMGEPFNVPLDELPNAEAIRSKAAELGVVFPGWK